MDDSERLSKLMEIIHELTRDADPLKSSMRFIDSLKQLYGNFGLLSISMRGLKPNEYRVMRLIHQEGLASEDLPDMAFAGPDAPIYTGGFVGDIIRTGKLGLVERSGLQDDPVLGNRLKPYKAYLVQPIITLGKLENYLIEFTTDPSIYTREGIELRLLLANLMGNLSNTKRLAMELDTAHILNDRLEAQRTYLTDEIALDHTFDEIVFQSRAFKQVLAKLEQVAQTDATVLLLGESGTGKELLAHSLHRMSRRRKMPLIKVNCATLSENLVESELFGHVKGAFTGATSDRSGRFDLADGGTIFLDELGELPLALQAKLLRVLQSGEYERLGEGITRKVDVRVMAATNRDLEKEVKEGRFREDLYYRLNVFPIESPPLRKRKEDIPLLALHFLRKYNAAMGKSVERITTEAMQTLQTYDWPGNVRELQNIVERAVILSRGSDLDIAQAVGSASWNASNIQNSTSLFENEKQFVLQNLVECDWRIQGPEGAANRLELSPSTLRNRMKRLGIVKPKI